MSTAQIKMTPQQELVYNYLKSGSTLTNKVALTCLNVGSLTSRISELRKLGIKIDTRVSRGADGRSYKKYDLGE